MHSQPTLELRVSSINGRIFLVKWRWGEIESETDVTPEVVRAAREHHNFNEALYSKEFKGAAPEVIWKTQKK